MKFEVAKWPSGQVIVNQPRLNFTSVKFRIVF